MKRYKLEINNPELFHIKRGEMVYQGPNQSWYKEAFQRTAGCGPTACSNIMWYLSKTRQNYQNLCPYDGSTYDGFLSLMEDMWNYVTPGFMGVNKLEMLMDGAISYGKERGINLKCSTYGVPGTKIFTQPDVKGAITFLESAIKKDLPVAFLNLSNGKLKNLESWHWVTIWALDLENEKISILDQSRIEEVDLRLWITTTSLGGGFVVIE